MGHCTFVWQASASQQGLQAYFVSWSCHCPTEPADHAQEHCVCSFCLAWLFLQDPCMYYILQAVDMLTLVADVPQLLYVHVALVPGSYETRNLGHTLFSVDNRLEMWFDTQRILFRSGQGLNTCLEDCRKKYLLKQNTIIFGLYASQKVWTQYRTCLPSTVCASGWCNGVSFSKGYLSILSGLSHWSCSTV